MENNISLYFKYTTETIQAHLKNSHFAIMIINNNFYKTIWTLNR